MVTGMRVEGRHQRIDRAAMLAAADLLALYRGDTSLAPRDRLVDLVQAVAAASFVAEAEEALRGGEDDMVAREEYAIAHEVMKAVWDALPAPQRKLLLLRYREDKTLKEAQEELGVHYNTVARWHDKVLAEIQKQLEKRGITHSPGRGGAPQVAVLVPLAGDEPLPGNDGGERPRR
jgi:RNA polymerase sigma factor (sigma-70 family)